MARQYCEVLGKQDNCQVAVSISLANDEPEPPTQAAPRAECEATYVHHRRVRLSWANLLKRVFEIDMEQ